MRDIKLRVRQFIADNLNMGFSVLPFADADSFMNKGIIDSTGFLELVSYLEETFEFEVADDEMTPQHLDSLDNIAAYVSRKLAA